MFQCGLAHGPQHLQRHTCSCMDLSHSPLSCDPAPTHPCPWLEFLCRCSQCILGLFMVTRFEVLQHDLMHSHWCFKVNLLHHGDFSTATDALWCGFFCFSMDLSLGYGPSAAVWTYPSGHRPFRHVPTVAHNHSTGTFRYTCYGIDLSMATDALGCPACTWSHP